MTNSFFVGKRLRWIIIIMILFLVSMLIYRLFFFYHYNVSGLPFSGSTIILGLRFDLRYVCILGLFIFFLSSINYFNPFKRNKAKRFWVPFLTIIFLLTVVIYTSDFYHYDYLKQRLNASVLNFAEDAGISLTMMKESYPIIKILIGFIAVSYLWYFFMKNLIIKITLKDNVSYKSKNWILVLFIIVSGIFIFGNLGQYPLRWSDAYRFGNEYRASVALNPFQSFLSTMKFRATSFDLKKVRSSYSLVADFLGVKNKDENNLNFNRNIVYSDTSSPKPNVILVICESFSSYKSSMLSNPLNPSPYFNSLSNKGVYFERCFTPSFGTARGVWATITGIPDVERPKTASRNPLAVNQHTIINDFKGYDKFYFLGGSTTWANIRGLLTNNIEGVKIYEGGDFKSKTEDVWGISDKNLFMETSAILSANKKPFFAIIQTAGNHRPYTIPEEDLDEFKRVNFSHDSLIKYGFENNDELNAFRYMDFSIQKFMEAAAKTEYYDNTIFVFVGDHGIAGNAGNILPKSYTQQNLLAEHVPLLFYSNKYLMPKKVNDVCSQIDILPSIASIAKQSYTNSTLGRSLFDLENLPKYAFITDPDRNSTGVVGNEYYFVKYNSGPSKFVSILNNNDVIVNAASDSIKSYMEKLTDGIQETSKYLLLNNKKQN